MSADVAGDEHAKDGEGGQGKDDVEEIVGDHRGYLVEHDVAGLAENHRRCQQAEPRTRVQDAGASVNALSAPASYPKAMPR